MEVIIKDDRYYLELAFAEAEMAANEGSIPIGVVIVGPDGEIVSTGTVEPCPMCSGALILADLSRYVWALTDDYLGAMRVMKDGQHFRHKFDKIEITPQPYEDLTLRSEKLHKTFDLGRGKGDSKMSSLF